MNSTTKPRTYSGRIAVDGARNVERVNITLEPQQRAQLKELGGSAWVRKKLRDAACAQQYLSTLQSAPPKDGEGH